MKVHFSFLFLLLIFLSANILESNHLAQNDKITSQLINASTFQIINVGSSRANGIHYYGDNLGLNMAVPMQNYYMGRKLINSYMSYLDNSKIIIPVDYFTFCNVDEFPIEPYLNHLAASELGITSFEQSLKLKLPFVGMNNNDAFIRNILRFDINQDGSEVARISSFDAQARYLAESDANRLSECMSNLENEIQLLTEDIAYWESQGHSTYLLLIPYHSSYSTKIDNLTDNHLKYLELISKTNIPIIDLRTIFDNKTDEVFSDPYHLNETGNRLLSDEIQRIFFTN